ncbi:MAG: hypothetical protein Q4G46_00375 [Propionibacteriaceae bacterium]|nr:hypothetical protein [Propionibacteriaceae bacterium]
MTDNKPSISRRTLAKGAAWAVPVIALSSQAPAFAASPGEVYFQSLGIACKLPGASCEKDVGITKGYIIRVDVCSSLAANAIVTIRSAMISLNGQPATLWHVSADPTSPYVLSAGGGGNPVILDMRAPTAGDPCVTLDFGVEGEPSSSQGSIHGTASYSYVSAGTESGDKELSMGAPVTPPCDDCAIVDVPNE